MTDKVLHKIQIDILIKLMQSSTGRTFSELLPDNLKLESFKFNYHLQYLVKEGLIEKRENDYALTEVGLNFISPYTISGAVEGFHKISVALVVFRMHAGSKEILLQERSRHPFYGDITSIAGKVRSGEHILDAAQRKLKEEAGLEAQFTMVGVLRKCKYNQEGVLLEDTFYHYCVANTSSGELIEKNEHGKNFWVPIEHAAFKMKDTIDSGIEDKKLFEKLISGDTSWFYIEQDQTLKEYTRE